MAKVYIGIGSNLGNSAANCLEAIGRLQTAGCRILKVSGQHITEPWGLRDQPSFVNMAAEIETARTPEDLLALLKEIESDMGREESVKWGPRLIDLDILLYEDLVVNNASVTIPHPLLHEREFALGPLAEIAPNVLHPVLGKSVEKLLAEAKA